MLKTLDVLIGFTLVMLVMSMAVTMVTQFLGTWLLNLKGVSLREGLTRLLANLDSGLAATDARKIAEYVLRNPLVGQPKLFSTSHSLGSVVHREELVKLLFEFASDGDADKVADQMNEDPCPHEEKQRLQHVMRKSLAGNGIENPKDLLESIRAATLELEKTSPELSTSMRAAAAILNHAASPFLAKLNNWFDQTIDRVSESFTVRIRIVTLGVSLGVALFFQLNAFQVLNRLSLDDELRSKAVTAAYAQLKQTAPTQQVAAETVAPQGETATKAPEIGCPAPPRSETAQEPDVGKALRDCVAPLEQLGLIAFPKSWDEWAANWGKEWSSLLLQLIGILLSAALLSLGAPFWYAQLANLVRLRSVVSGKDDRERAERQTTQPAVPSAATLPPDYRGGEAGDLAATG